MPDEQTDLDQEILMLARANLSGGVILRALTRSCRDADEDDVLLVKILYQGRRPDLDPETTARFTTILRRHLEELGDTRFPVISYEHRSSAPGDDA